MRHPGKFLSEYAWVVYRGACATMASPPAAEAAVAAADEEGQHERGRIALDLAIARETNVHPL